MAQKANATAAGAKKSNFSWGWSIFSDTTSTGFSWVTFTIVIAITFMFVFLLQSLVVTRGNCISRSVHRLSTIVTSPGTLLPAAPETPANPNTPTHRPALQYPTELSRVVFGIAGAAKNLRNRKEYIRRWYNLESKTRAIVWLDQEVNGTWERDMPPFRVSEDISKYPGFNLRRRTATRIARIVSEMYRLELPDVDWFVMGDDDTFFLPDNVVKVLSKYDPKQLFYIGSNSETHIQNLLFSFNMAFGGGGFAISLPLAKELAKVQDKCLARYPNLFGSDERIFACMSELGIPLTRELGFHQMDIRGNAMGLLAAHPQAALVSIHHLDMINPIFPGLNKYSSLDHLLESARVESASVLQQSMCYSHGLHWSFSISWGYVVQVYKGFLPPRDLETPLRTFSSIKRSKEKHEFPFNTRDPPKDPCRKPSMFYMKSVTAGANSSEPGNTGLLESVYLRNEDLQVTRPNCESELKDLGGVRRIRVLKNPIAASWFQAPRRSCCKVTFWSKDSIELQLSDCRYGETLLTS